MTEGIPKANNQERTIERRAVMPEETALSKQVTGFSEVASSLLPEHLQKELADIIEKVVALEKRVRIDDLTGLLNRVGFRDEWDRSVALLQRENAKGKSISSAFFAIDLDGFKSVNDSVGHDGGDEFLKLASEKMQGILHKENALGRIGGDEFLAFFIDLSPEKAKKVAQKLREAIEEVNVIMREKYTQYGADASASIGIVTIDGEGHIGDDQYTTLEQHPTMAKIRCYADYALYVAKKQGKRGEYTLREAWDADPDRTLEKAYRNIK